ncbi:hypothetical protein C3K47_15625 [Solitalea longa]|uniref:Uncharacterized protein n=1 Tax=Solitalea longa TaxID=2079460 RepID=A0A2S4ZYP6_9SPHI|nr:hypothetical protein [Solitalea longa]POY35488.1 hypothetical protein C3K47_15625 [Solitalea longa]
MILLKEEKLTGESTIFTKGAFGFTTILIAMLLPNNTFHLVDYVDKRTRFYSQVELDTSLILSIINKNNFLTGTSEAV